MGEEPHDRFSWKRLPISLGQRFDLRLKGPVAKDTSYTQEDRWLLTVKQRLRADFKPLTAHVQVPESRFAEGFDTADLQEAKTLLAALGPSVARAT